MVVTGKFVWGTKGMARGGLLREGKGDQCNGVVLTYRHGEKTVRICKRQHKRRE